MLHQAKEIINYLNSLDDTSDDIKALLLEKKLERIFGESKVNGFLVRTMTNNSISIVRRGYTLDCKRTSSNAFTIISSKNTN